MLEYDALIIGCGLSGGAIARYLAEKGKKVLIWDRRKHVGGNMYDYKDEHGILVHKYGPHTFHTKKKYLYDFMSRFAEWQHYELTCGAEIDGKCVPTPFNYTTIDTYYTDKEAESIKKCLEAEFVNREFATVTEALNSRNNEVRGYAQFLFDKDYSLYTAKQWGVSAEEIDPSVLKRVPLRFSYEEGYFDDEFQVMPAETFTEFFKNLLNHPGITVELEVEALDRITINNDEIFVDNDKVLIPVIYTGALDELFDMEYGVLPYRSLRFEWKYEEIDSKQKYPVVAYPQEDGFTRITEYKKLPVQDVKGTTYAVEYPLPYKAGEKNEPYYPVLTEESQHIYAMYKEKADVIKNLYCCGRLADFKYYNMDQALERALTVAEKIIAGTDY